MSKKTIFLTLFLVAILLFLPFFRTVSQANSLAQGYLLLERMKVSTATDMTVMFTPATSYSGTDPISLRIIFPEATAGTWCTTNATTLTIAGAGVGASPIDQGAWTIDAALPAVTTLVATCYQGTGGGTDYIEVTDIGPLTGGTSYGFTLSPSANFITGANSGSNIISYQLIEDNKIEAITFPVALLADDQVTISAEVLAVDTLTCTVGDDVALATLFLGGAYITGDHTLSTNATLTMGFYWTVAGTGDGSAAGLWKSTETTYLISSTGSLGKVNLVTGEGFGMVLAAASTPVGTIQPNYNPASLATGEFGSILLTPTVILISEGGGVASHTVTYGARAGIDAQAGNYVEVLTYVCGGYIGSPA